MEDFEVPHTYLNPMLNQSPKIRLICNLLLELVKKKTKTGLFWKSPYPLSILNILFKKIDCGEIETAPRESD